MLAEAAVKRLIVPNEIAEPATWLASSLSTMVTDASYTIDGGWTAR